MKIRTLCLLLAGALLAGILFSACKDTPPASAETGDTTVQVNPLPESVSKNEMTARLYFGYQQYKLLAGESRKIKVPVNESTEVSILNELIKEGPSATRVDFVQVINPETSVSKVSSEGQYLVVTLSREFLEPVGGAIDYQDEEQVSYEKTRKFLAVYSIVNTLIEQGNYSRVRIMIDDDGVGGGRPLTMQEAGLDGAGTAEPFEWDGSIELNAQNTMREILTAVEKREWSTVYDYIAYKNSYGQDKPSLEDFRNEAEAAKFSISGMQIIGDVLAPDGVTNVVMVSYVLKQQDGEAQTLSNVPVKLMQENDIWKLTYNTFKNTFMT